MEVLQRPLFITCTVLFLLHQLLQWGLKVHLPWADNYLDNLLVMPIALSLWLAEKRWLFRMGKQYELSLMEIIVATVYILLITELLFPMLAKRFTADAWDLAYTVAGSFIYFITAKKYQRQPSVMA